MLTYLAMPFSSPDPALMTQRMTAFWGALAHWVGQEGVFIVSPLLLQPMFAHADPMPSDWRHWERYSMELLGKSDHVMVLALPGWDTSAGVARELAEADRLGKLVVFIDPETYELIAVPNAAVAA